MNCHAKDGLFVKTNEYYHKICYHQILWVEASRSYADIHLRDGKTVTVACPLKEVYRRLPAATFIRIHNSYAVNLFEIDTFCGSAVKIKGKIFTIGRTFREETLVCLNVLGIPKTKANQIIINY